MLNLGDVNFGLGVDTRRLNKSVVDIVKFGSTVETAAAKTAKGSKLAAAALKKQEEAALRALQKTLNFAAAVRKSGIATSQQQRVQSSATKAFREYTVAVTRGQMTTLGFSRANSKLEADLGRTNRQLKKYTASIKEPSKPIIGLNEAIRDLASASVLAVGPLSGIGARLNALAAIATRTNIAMAAFLGGIVAGGVVLFKLSAGATTAAFALDKINARLNATSTTARESSDEFEYLRNLADDTGTSFVDLANSFTKMKAAASGSSIGEGYRQVFEDITVASASFRLDAAETQGVLKAVEQIMSKGTVQAEELRGQLGDRLPGAFTIAARAMGVTTSELNKMLKAGEVLSDDFLPKFAAELRRTLGADHITRIDSLQASYVRMTESVLFFNMQFDETFKVSQKVQGAMEGITSIVKFAERNMQDFAVVIGAVGGAFIAMSLPRIAAGFLIVGKAIKSATLFMWGLNAAMLANPATATATVLTRAALAVAGIFAGIAIFSKGAQAETAGMDDLTDSIDNYIKAQNAARRAQSDVTSDRIADLQKLIQASAAHEAAVKSELDVEMKAQAQRTLMQSFGAGSSGIGRMVIDGEMFSAQQVADRIALTQKEAALSKTSAALAEYTAQILELTALQKIQRAEETEAARLAAEVIKEKLQASDLEIERIYATARATDESTRAILELNAEYARIDAIQDFSDNLTKSGVEAEIATVQVERFTAAYDNLQKSLKNQATEKVLGAITSNEGRARATLEGPEALAQFEGDEAFTSAIENRRKALEAANVDITISNALLGMLAASMQQVAEAEKQMRLEKIMDGVTSAIAKARNEAAAMSGTMAEFEAFEESERVLAILDDVAESLRAEGKSESFIIQTTAAYEAAIAARAQAWEDLQTRIKAANITDILSGIQNQIDTVNERAKATAEGSAALAEFEKSLQMDQAMDALEKQFIDAGGEGDEFLGTIDLLRAALINLDQVAASVALDKAFSSTADAIARVRAETAAMSGTEADFTAFTTARGIAETVDKEIEALSKLGAEDQDLIRMRSDYTQALSDKATAWEAYQARVKAARGGGGGDTNAAEEVENLRLVNEELLRMSLSLEAMQQGPEALRLLNEQFERDDAIASYAKQLEKLELPIEVATAKLEEFIRLHDQIEAAQQQLDDFSNVWDSIGQSVESGLMAMVEGTMTVKEAFKQMAYEVIKELYRVLVVQRLVNSVTGALSGGSGSGLLGSLFGGTQVAGMFSAKGNVFGSSGHAKMFGKGDVFGSPTAFQYGDGKLGVMGEAGDEGVFPLKRGSDGKLGVIAHGGTGTKDGDTYKISQEFNIQTASQQDFQRMLAIEMPGIMNMSMMNILDKSARGEITL